MEEKENNINKQKNFTAFEVSQCNWGNDNIKRVQICAFELLQLHLLQMLRPVSHSSVGSLAA